MRKVKLLDDWNGNPKSSIVNVDNNIAHTLLDKGKATLNLKDMVDYPDKMLRSNNKIIKRKNARNARKPKNLSRHK